MNLSETIVLVFAVYFIAMLGIGTILSWLLVAPRLRRFSIVAGDSVTLPQYLTNRFLSRSRALRIISAVLFLAVYTIYAASSIKACGTLFNIVMGIDTTKAMYLAAAIIVGYTFLGGFSAVCWTDFVQGLIMLVALMVTPIAALFMMDKTDFSAVTVTANYWSLLPAGKMDWGSISEILTGLGWGIGYFGMPHIIIIYICL